MQHYRVDPDLGEELAAFGGSTLGRCFSCGNCTAVCGLSKGDTVFPRKIIRYLQVGLSDRLLESPEPWLCYYCGTCSDTCPRSAEPGELMMATRRWLVSHYDWTGLSRRLYLSEAWEFGLLGLIAAFVLSLFLVPGWLGVKFGFAAIDAAAAAHVRLDLFAPNPWVHTGDLLLAALLALLLGINAARMSRFVARGRAGLEHPASIWIWQGVRVLRARGDAKAMAPVRQRRARTVAPPFPARHRLRHDAAARRRVPADSSA